MARSSTKRRKQPEEALQRQVAQFLDAALLAPAWWTHFPAGGLRSKATAAKLKAAGLKPGVADCLLFYPHPLRTPPTPQILAIELKAGRNSLSLDQRRKHAQFERLGAYTAVCKTLVEVEQACVEAGVPMRGRIA